MTHINPHTLVQAVDQAEAAKNILHGFALGAAQSASITERRAILRVARLALQQSIQCVDEILSAYPTEERK
jgi:hypothetical protein